jgi:hypothetical protein
MRVVVIVLVAWFLLSIPVAIVVGKYLKRVSVFYPIQDVRGRRVMEPGRDRIVG